MFTREEKKQLNTDFYTGLGLMMQGSVSERGRKVQWTNYKTNVKNIFVRMETDKRGTKFCIDLQHRDESVRLLIWEQFEELKKLLENTMQTELIWHREFYKEDNTVISRIETLVVEGSIYNKSTWPVLLGFLKQCLLKFDEFWAMSFDIFKELED